MLSDVDFSQGTPNSNKMQHIEYIKLRFNRNQGQWTNQATARTYERRNSLAAFFLLLVF